MTSILPGIYPVVKSTKPSAVPPDIQAPAGALLGAQADRGQFITTAQFSSGAKSYTDSVNTRVILIDGSRLAELMFRFGAGVQIQQTINIVKLDEDYFE